MACFLGSLSIEFINVTITIIIIIIIVINYCSDIIFSITSPRNILSTLRGGIQKETAIREPAIIFIATLIIIFC